MLAVQAIPIDRTIPDADPDDTPSALRHPSITSDDGER